MRIVTEAACSLAAELLDNAQAADDVAVRVFFEGDDLAMQLDHSLEGDSSFDHNGRVVLILAEDVMAEIGSQTLDIKETADGPTLTFC